MNPNPLGPGGFWNRWDPRSTWWRCTSKKDRRLLPKTRKDEQGRITVQSIGRRMIHPVLDPIVYPHMPDETTNFDHAPVRRVTVLSVKTLTSNAVAKFEEVQEDVRITETWLSDKGLSTLTGMFRQFHRYWTTALDPGRYIGWHCPDLTWRRFFVELLDVRLGGSEDFNVEELGDKRPHIMRQQLSVTFKLVRTVEAPAGVIGVAGY